VPPDYEPISAEPPVERSEGAIWSGESAGGSFLFFDRKARGLGDLVTVLVLEDFSAQGTASTSLDKSSSLSADLSSDLGFTEALRQGTEWFFELIGVDEPGQDVPAGATLNAIDSSQTSSFEGDGETTRGGRLRAVVTCRVVDVLPNGVFHLRGSRRIVVNHELQLLTVEGLARREDISIQNAVPSTSLAEAQLTFDGIGVLDDKQRPPLLARVMDWIYPF
jgi:flagellar L-ring protein precursor FlgH